MATPYTTPPKNPSDVDVLIVGAGPGGSAAALSCLQQGFSSVLLLDRAPFPRHKTCGSGLSPRLRHALNRFNIGLWGRIEPLAYPIKAARFISQNGNETTLGGPYTAAVLNRADLDQLLANTASQHGAIFRDHTRVKSLIEQNGRVVGVTTSTGEHITATHTILANGAKNALTHLDPRPKRTLQTCVAWFKNVPHPPNTLDMVYDPAVSPHYAWLFPETADRVNIGLCIDQDKLQGSIRDLFKTILDKYWGEQIKDAEQIGDWQGHPILCTDTIEHHAPPGVLLVGEANRLVNIATGEGISYAVESGWAAGQILGQARKNNWNDQQTSQHYLKLCKKLMGLSLKGGEWFRRYGVPQLNTLVKMGNTAPARWISKLIDQPAPTWKSK